MPISPQPSAQPTVVIAATVAIHLRNFHLPWIGFLRRSGQRVIGVASDIRSCERCTAAFDEVYEVPFSRSAVSWAQAFRSGRALRKLCERWQPALVHFHTPNAAFWGRLGLAGLVKAERLKVAYTAHGFHFHRHGNPLLNPAYRAAEGCAARWTHALLTINQDDYRAACGFRLAPGGFTHFVPGAGLEWTKFTRDEAARQAARARCRAELGLQAADRVVLMMAEFNPGKRHVDFLRALPGCRARPVALFAGQGKLLEAMSARVKASGLEAQVRFLGYRNDIPDLLCAADAVVLPSEREGLAVCLLEAMAMGVPVVGSDARGVADLVGDDCGYEFPLGDAARLAQALDALFDQPDEAARRAAKARQRVLTQYSWEAVQRALTEVYRRLGVFSSHSERQA